MGVLKAKRNGQQVAYRLDKAAVIVGSGENCNIRVPDAGLVTRHCQILKMENGYVLRDMSGEVGTFVNGKKVNEAFDVTPREGRIQLQTELAEIFYRRWELWPLGQGPKPAPAKQE